jgi:hypothetical protein
MKETGRRSEELSRDEAIEALAYELNYIQEKMDPSPDGDWDSYSEADKDFFRRCIHHLLSRGSILTSALSASPTTTS